MTFKKLTEEEKLARRAAKAALQDPTLKASEPDAEEPEEEEPAKEKEDPVPQQAKGFATKLSENAKKVITENARQKVQQQLNEAEKKKFLDSELDRLRAEAGLAAPSALGGTHDELVTFKLDLGYEGQAYVQLNIPHGPKYFHGLQYTTPRHIFNTLNEIAFRGAQLTQHVEGKSVYRNRKYGTSISPSNPKGVNSEVTH